LLSPLGFGGGGTYTLSGFAECSEGQSYELPPPFSRRSGLNCGKSETDFLQVSG